MYPIKIIWFKVIYYCIKLYNTDGALAVSHPTLRISPAYFYPAFFLITTKVDKL